MKTPKKILIVDDEPSIVFAIEQLLLAHDYIVEKAYNGEEGLVIARSFEPHLILLDVMMPLLDGFEFSATIRNDKTLSDTKIIFLTAKGELSDKKDGYARGCDDYMVKPFSSDQLLSKVAYTLSM